MKSLTLKWIQNEDCISTEAHGWSAIIYEGVKKPYVLETFEMECGENCLTSTSSHNSLQGAKRKARQVFNDFIETQL